MGNLGEMTVVDPPYLIILIMSPYDENILLDVVLIKNEILHFVHRIPPRSYMIFVSTHNWCFPQQFTYYFHVDIFGI